MYVCEDVTVRAQHTREGECNHKRSNILLSIFMSFPTAHHNDCLYRLLLQITYIKKKLIDLSGNLAQLPWATQTEFIFNICARG